MDIREMGLAAKSAAVCLSALSTDVKNAALQAIAVGLRTHANELFEANRKDLSAAEAAGLDTPLLKRLRFDEKKLGEVLAGLESLQALPEPTGVTQKATELDEGLELFRVSCPIGVVGIIFESRPDALVQISTLCLKSGNAVLLKGGSEALNTNRALAKVILEASTAAGAPDGWLHLLETRADVNEMLQQDDLIDLIVPRGSNAFVRYIMDHTRIAVMGHSDGICHTYVDDAADIPMAVRLVVDSKTQYVSVCNATEHLLVHRNIAAAFLPAVVEALRAKHVRLLGDDASRAIVPDLEPASDDEWDKEYLDYILSIKLVDSLEEAAAHINRHGSGHTDMIATQDAAHAARFVTIVDSADVFWNASTRFADGFRYGLGAEVGIATGKLHARGPVGLEGLCTYKYVLCGHGQIVADYAEGRSHFTHKMLDKRWEEDFQN
ncbi:MAG: glutamate-5-semialdehyde dehydrogenase [Victivallales bacterium]|nr:glutamate-5-semialdehyde dehydrogenase [Victivallales bacterium]